MCVIAEQNEGAFFVQFIFTSVLCRRAPRQKDIQISFLNHVEEKNLPQKLKCYFGKNGKIENTKKIPVTK